jgi:hypothetical protein
VSLREPLRNQPEKIKKYVKDLCYILLYSFPIKYIYKNEDNVYYSLYGAKIECRRRIYKNY